MRLKTFASAATILTAGYLLVAAFDGGWLGSPGASGTGVPASLYAVAGSLAMLAVVLVGRVGR